MFDYHTYCNGPQMNGYIICTKILLQNTSIIRPICTFLSPVSVSHTFLLSLLQYRARLPFVSMTKLILPFSEVMLSPIGRRTLLFVFLTHLSSIQAEAGKVMLCKNRLFSYKSKIELISKLYFNRHFF